MSPNIRPATQPHSACERQDYSGPNGFPGDVRRCQHGKTQVLTEVPVGAPVQGPGTHWWRDLSPFWNPVLYRRAKQALEQP